ncbi:MAG: hypothetical protein AAF694_12890, partial [Bacteroidota bacterium]
IPPSRLKSLFLPKFWGVQAFGIASELMLALCEVFRSAKDLQQGKEEILAYFGDLDAAERERANQIVQLQIREAIKAEILLAPLDFESDERVNLENGEMTHR